MSDSTDDVDWYDPDLERYNCWEEHRMLYSTSWLLKNKTIVKIKAMTTTHIKNAMKMLEKINWTECQGYLGLQKEYLLRKSDE